MWSSCLTKERWCVVSLGASQHLSVVCLPLPPLTLVWGTSAKKGLVSQTTQRHGQSKEFVAVSWPYKLGYEQGSLIPRLSWGGKRELDYHCMCMQYVNSMQANLPYTILLERVGACACIVSCPAPFSLCAKGAGHETSACSGYQALFSLSKRAWGRGYGQGG